VIGGAHPVAGRIADAFNAMPTFPLPVGEAVLFLGQIAHESARFRALEEYASGEAYEGRADLGNIEIGDGPRFKGRGLIQITGRANYAALSPLHLPETGEGINLVAEPDRAAEPDVAVEVAILYWLARVSPGLRRSFTVRSATLAVNGGDNGLEDRVNQTLRARLILEQLALKRIGINPGPIDGVSGPRTRAALRLFTDQPAIGLSMLLGAGADL